MTKELAASFLVIIHHQVLLSVIAAYQQNYGLVNVIWCRASARILRVKHSMRDVVSDVNCCSSGMHMSLLCIVKVMTCSYTRNLSNDTTRDTDCLLLVEPRCTMQIKRSSRWHWYDTILYSPFVLSLVSLTFLSLFIHTMNTVAYDTK